MAAAEPRRVSLERRTFPPGLKSIGSARDLVADVLGHHDVRPPIDPSLVADVQLVVSELVTNAVSHSSSPTVVEVAITTTHLRCSVTSVRDDDPPPAMAPFVTPPASSRSGRGLTIVHALADVVVAAGEQSAWAVDCEFARR